MSSRNGQAAHPGDVSSLAAFVVLLFAGAAACTAACAPAFLECSFLAGAAATSAAFSLPVRQRQNRPLIRYSQCCYCLQLAEPL